MYILILGGGSVGFSMAKMLSSDLHDVTLVDKDPETVENRSDALDARVILGNASHVTVLFQANVMNADLCLAVTDSDETNLVAASLAKRLGARRVVARVYSHVANNLKDFDYCSHFGIDKIISLEQLTALQLAQKIDSFAKSLNLDSYLYEDLELMEFTIQTGAKGLGRRIRDLDFPSNVRIGCIRREMNHFIPGADDVLKVNDEIAIFGLHEDLIKVCKRLGGKLPKPQDIVIAGGGETGIHLAQLLQKRHRVRILETDRDRCQQLAARLDRSVEVLNIDVHNRNDMEEEHIGKADIFVACTGFDENNLIGCVEAKEMGVRKVFCVINRTDYGGIIQKLGIDYSVSPQTVAARCVNNFLNQGVVISRENLFNSPIQLLEVEVQKNSPVSRCTLKDAQLSPQCIVLAAHKHGSTATVPGASYQFTPGDIALLVTRDQHSDKITAKFEEQTK